MIAKLLAELGERERGDYSLVIQNILEGFYLEFGFSSPLYYKNDSAMLTEVHWHISGLTKGELSLTVCSYEGYMYSSLLYELFAWYCCRGFFSQHVDVIYFLQIILIWKLSSSHKSLIIYPGSVGNLTTLVGKSTAHIHTAAAHTGSEPMI